MQSVMTIQEFQTLMAKEDNRLFAILRQISEQATLGNMQKMEPTADPDPVSTWVGWR